MIVRRPLLIPRGDAAELLVAVYESLDLVPLAVNGPVEGAGAMFIRFPGDGDPDAMSPHVLSDPTAAIGLVAHEALRPVFRPAGAAALHSALGHELGKEDRFMPLARRQQQRQELAGAVGTEVDFGAEATSAPPERLGLGIPFFAPAACWWARTMVLSTKCTSQSS